MNDIKELKDLAEYTARHFGSEWSSALIGSPEENYHGIICEEKGEELVRTQNDELKNSWICDYLEAVDPSTILQIIDKLVLLEARVKELDERLSLVRQQRDEELNKNTSLEAVPEGWEACSPEWIERNGSCSCSEAPRIAFGEVGPHYHPAVFASSQPQRFVVVLPAEEEKGHGHYWLDYVDTVEAIEAAQSLGLVADEAINFPNNVESTAG